MKILLVFGTRPEAIKMAPLVKIFENDKSIDCKVCVTAQHRQMLDQVLDIFCIKPDFDLNIMKENQDLFDVTTSILLLLKDVLNKFKPDIILVHGDTTTTLAATLAGFYHKIRIGHVEAGLRTNNIYSPFPEEANRKLVSAIATYHFAPTQISKDNLLREGINEKQIFITGNTVIDALFLILDTIQKSQYLKEKILKNIGSKYSLSQRKFILVTGHRRENFGQSFIDICESLKEIAILNPHIDIVYPVHLNPNVQKPVNKILKDIANVYLCEPLEYESFVYLMSRSYFIITDSGGIQEEAPSLGKPVLVTRDTTERPEAVSANTVILVGANKKKIVDSALKLLNDEKFYEKMSRAHNPYGDGEASRKIIKILKGSKN